MRQAFERFKTANQNHQFEEFVAANRVWLDDYLLYAALKDVHGGLPWFEWEPDLVARDPSALCPVAGRAGRGNPLP